MRGIAWIAGIALLGLGALFLAWRLLPTPARDGAASPVASPAPIDEPQAQRAPVPTREAAVAVKPLAPGTNADTALDASPPDGVEDGGAPISRPLPDFSDTYAGFSRFDLVRAADELERRIVAARKALTRVEVAELDARLAGQLRTGEPTARVRALMAQADELQWLRQRLALPSPRDPDAPEDNGAPGSVPGG